MKLNNGRLQVDRFDSTDVDLAYATWKSTGGNTFIKINGDGYIVDIVLNITSAGTTKDFKLWIDQQDTLIRWVQSANFNTLNNRFPMTAPIPVRAGQTLMLQVLA